MMAIPAGAPSPMVPSATTEEPQHERAAQRSAGGAIARNAAHLVMGQAVTTVLAVLLSAALGRSLGAGDFGLLFLIQSMAQFAFVVVEWGQLQYVVREVAKDAGQAGLLLGSSLALRVAGTVLLTALTVVGAWAFGYDGRTQGLAALLMAAMLPFVLAQAFALVFRGRERMEYESFVSMLNKAGTLGLTLLALWFGSGLSGAILAQGAAGLVALAAAAFLVRRLDLGPIRATGTGARRILAGGAPIVVMSVAIAGHGYIEAIVLSKMGSAESIGWFGAARVILGTLIAPATILGSSAYPRLSRAAHDPAGFRAELQVAIRPLLGLAVLGAVGTYLFAPGAVQLIYGAESFGPAATILQVFAPGLLLLFLDILFGSAVLAVGRPVPLAIGKVVNIAASTVLAVVLVPLCQERWGNGGIGIALAFCASELIMFATATWLLPRGTLGVAAALDAGRSLLAGAVTLVIFLALPSLPLLVGAPLCVVVFVTLAAATGLVRPSELGAIAAKVRSRIAGG